MIEESKILKVLYTWKDYFKRKRLLDRTICDDIIKYVDKEVIDIIGVRRSGKSSLLNLIMQKLIIDESQILFVNFEDPVFANDLSLELLDKIWEVYRIKINSNKEAFIFLDEIQLIPRWEKWVRKARDLELAKIFATGSSSKLMSKEYGTALTGRHISFTLYPLSYKEYLQFKNVNLQINEKSLILNEMKFRKYFEEYLVDGGFPEFVLSNNKELLKNYFEDILYKDIIMRHEVRDVNLLRRLANYCLTNIAQPISYNSLKNIFKVSHEKIRTYLSYLEESLLIYQLIMFSYSLKVQEVNPKKIYCIDNGLRNSISFKFMEEKGKLVENLVFLEFLRRKKEIYYWQGKNEVDFIIKNDENSLIALNVTYSDDIKGRELKGLREFKKKYKSKVGKLILLTKNTEKVEDSIIYIPIWKWVLLN